MNRENRKLNAFSLAVTIVFVNYGSGFLLGTAEKAFAFDFAGSLYAFCTALAPIALLGLARFYWEEVEQIWTLLGDRYGSQVKFLVASMSWVACIGIEGVQIIAGAFILKVLGLPVNASMAIVAIAFIGISLLPVEKASLLLQVLLALNLVGLFYVLWALQGVPDYLQSPLEFLPSLTRLDPREIAGISLSTLGLAFIDMGNHQFIVQAKDLTTVYRGCFLAAALLLLLAFLPSALIVAAKGSGILPEGIDGKETIPFILFWIGTILRQPLAVIPILSLLVPVVGVGSNQLRLQNKTVFDFFDWLAPTKTNQFLVAWANGLLALGIALKGGAIIDLTVSFVAAYVAAAFIPFLAYLLENNRFYTFSAFSIKISSYTSSISALTLLALTLFDPDGAAVFGNPELGIMAIGIGFGTLGLLTGITIDKYVPALKIRQET